MKAPSARATFAIVAFGIFVAADDLTVVTTMLREIISDLNILLPDGLDDAAWVVNGYLIAYVAVMPIAGRLSDVFGRRPTYVGALVLFLIGSIWIPLAETMPTFLAGRVLTALGGGALVPIGMAVVSDLYHEPHRARALGALGAIDTLGWVWGPLFGAVLVRFLSWRWQFILNIPLAIIGIALAWWALRDLKRPSPRPRIDWTGALALTTFLVALDVALLDSARIQSVTGLDELTGAPPGRFRWLFAVAALALVGLWWAEHRAADPMIDIRLFRESPAGQAGIINFISGATLVIAMVDVPLFINVIETGLEQAAVISGWVLSALTGSMAVAAYLGGRWAETHGYKRPLFVGTVLIVVGFAIMGAGWDPHTSFVTMALQLAVLGFGFGLVIAPSAAAIVDSADPEKRGAAASWVMVLRLMGLSVGLAALTAWGLQRYNALRGDLDLPPITDPSYADALADAQRVLTTGALAETFVAAGAIAVIAIGAALTIRTRRIRRDA